MVTIIYYFEHAFPKCTFYTKEGAPTINYLVHPGSTPAILNVTQERNLRYWTWHTYVTPSLMGYMVGFNFDLFTLTFREVFL